MITWKKVKGKIVFCKDGFFMSFTKEQLVELALAIEEASTSREQQVNTSNNA